MNKCLRPFAVAVTNYLRVKHLEEISVDFPGAFGGRHLRAQHQMLLGYSEHSPGHHKFSLPRKAIYAIPGAPPSRPHPTLIIFQSSASRYHYHMNLGGIQHMKPGHTFKPRQLGFSPDSRNEIKYTSESESDARIR